MNNLGTKILIVILVLLILAAGGILAYKIIKDKDSKNAINEIANNQEENSILVAPVEEKKVQIYQGTERPIAVMIDNHSDAWPQAGLNDAYLVYEMIVEGGETRLMALFKGAEVNKIGPIRSSRHYYLDYAMENDAIYVHFGWSPQAQSDISNYSINNINGLVESEKSFWRATDSSHSYLHSVATSTSTILKLAENKGYSTKSSKKSVLNYVTDEVKLSNGKSATTVTIPHSNLQKVTYEYDAENGIYKRYARNKIQTDWSTGNVITTKNIIITLCDNYTLDDGENKGRQGLYNIGTFDGYYITNGKAIKIKCIKEARNLQTKYQDLEGNEIKVNDGNAWIHIAPKNANIEIKGQEVEEAETQEEDTL